MRMSPTQWLNSRCRRVSTRWLIRYAMTDGDFVCMPFNIYFVVARFRIVIYVLGISNWAIYLARTVKLRVVLSGGGGGGLGGGGGGGRGNWRQNDSQQFWVINSNLLFSCSRQRGEHRDERRACAERTSGHHGDRDVWSGPGQGGEQPDVAASNRDTRYPYRHQSVHGQWVELALQAAEAQPEITHNRRVPTDYNR